MSKTALFLYIFAFLRQKNGRTLWDQKRNFWNSGPWLRFQIGILFDQLRNWYKFIAQVLLFYGKSVYIGRRSNLRQKAISLLYIWPNMDAFWRAVLETAQPTMCYRLIPLLPLPPAPPLPSPILDMRRNVVWLRCFLKQCWVTLRCRWWFLSCCKCRKEEWDLVVGGRKNASEDCDMSTASIVRYAAAFWRLIFAPLMSVIMCEFECKWSWLLFGV